MKMQYFDILQFSSQIIHGNVELINLEVENN